MQAAVRADVRPAAQTGTDRDRGARRDVSEETSSAS